MNRYILRIVLAALLVSVCYSALGTNDDRVIDSFRQHRMSYESLDESSVFKFYSRSVLEGWLPSLLFVDGAAIEHNAKAVRKRFLKIQDVSTVYSYEVKELGEGQVILEVLYSKAEEDIIRKLGIRYVNTDGLYLVDGIELHPGWSRESEGLEEIDGF